MHLKDPQANSSDMRYFSYRIQDGLVVFDIHIYFDKRHNDRWSHALGQCNARYSWSHLATDIVAGCCGSIQSQFFILTTKAPSLVIPFSLFSSHVWISTKLFPELRIYQQSAMAEATVGQAKLPR